MTRNDVARREKVLTTDLCYYCENKRVSLWYCQYHLDKGKQKSERFKERYKQSGKCTRCGGLLDPDADQGHVKCITCREEIYISTNVRRRKHAVISD